MDKYPSPAYLLGSMIDDDVPHELALKIANGYIDVRPSLSDEQTHMWLVAMWQKLGPGHENTALAALAYPSDHIVPRYEHLAHEAGWKENRNAHTPEQK